MTLLFQNMFICGTMYMVGMMQLYYSWGGTYFMAVVDKHIHGVVCVLHWWLIGYRLLLVVISTGRFLERESTRSWTTYATGRLSQTMTQTHATASMDSMLTW
jgi:hypothetical protein